MQINNIDYDDYDSYDDKRMDISDNNDTLHCTYLKNLVYYKKMFSPCVRYSLWSMENLQLISCKTYFIIFNYSDVIMSAMASQIAGLSIICFTVCSGTDQRKHQKSASLTFVRGIHRWPEHCPNKGPRTRKMFPFDDVIMSILNAMLYKVIII